MQRADEQTRFGQRTIVFIDEIHRFNRAQQDAFLPFVEKGSIILIGATTENPSFEVTGARVSCCKFVVLKELTLEDFMALLKRALTDSRGVGDQHIHMDDDKLRIVAEFASGDARSALSTLEMVVLNGDAREDGIYVTEETLKECTSQKSFQYDKSGEEHYNLISALHKSMRNSDPDAAVYWLARMLEAGEDPLYIARRVVRFASEDVGIADSRALEVAVAAYEACHFIGMPECSVYLVHAVIYMAMSPKSNAMELAYIEAREDALHHLQEPVPLVIRNAPTALMKEAGYGKGYIYAHDTKEKIAAMDCLPDSLKGRRYYHPTEEGFEVRYKERLEKILQWKAAQRSK